MDFLKGNIRSMYGKYLSAAFGSALIGCIYTMVDTAVVGQYQVLRAPRLWRWWLPVGT